MALLSDQDRDRERRLQQLLLERISLRSERLLAREIAQTTRQTIGQWESTGQVQVPPEHQRRIDTLLKQVWRASVEALGGRILTQAKRSRGPSSIKQDEDLFALMVQEYLQQFGGEKIVRISETTRDNIISQIAKGRAQELGEKEIAKMIREGAPGIGRARSAVIARTESHAAGNFAAQESAKRTGAVTKKEWVAAAGSRTRDSHNRADGQIVGMSEPFTVGGAKLMHPGDPSGPAEEVINCRCAVAYLTDDTVPSRQETEDRLEEAEEARVFDENMEAQERIERRSSPRKEVKEERKNIIRSRLDRDQEKDIRDWLNQVRDDIPETFEERERRLLDNWVRGSRRKTSIELKEAAIQEFNLSGIAYSRVNYNLSQSNIGRTSQDLRMIYNNTQRELQKRGIKTVKLYRGVKSDIVQEGAVESWTTSRKIAEAFNGGGVFVEEVPIERILTGKGLPGWIDGPFGNQQEYMVMR